MSAASSVAEASQPVLCLVDDDPALSQVLSRRLGQQGFTVQSFCQPVTPQQLIAVAADVYLLDMRFAAQSGLTFIAPLRQALPNARIVMLTGYASIAMAVQAIKLGADDFLTKPVDFASLLQSLQSGHSDNNRELAALPQNESVAAAASPVPELAANFVQLSPEQMEWEHIQRVLQQQQGNVSQTARLLGMHRRTLQRKLQKRRP